MLAVVTQDDGLLRYRVRNRKVARSFEEARVIQASEQVNPLHSKSAKRGDQ